MQLSPQQDAALQATAAWLHNPCGKQVFRLFGYAGTGKSTPGDKLVCLRNRHDRGLLNGSIWRCTETLPSEDDSLKLQVSPEDDEGGATTITTHAAFFDGSENSLPSADRRRLDAFDFGNALTVHKAQGSQWDNVTLINEAAAFRENQGRWLYTALTRAAERITIAA